MAQMKAKEKEMKEEKEEERQVCGGGDLCLFEKTLCFLHPPALLTLFTASNSSNQRQAHKKGREGTIREDGREDAPQASGATEAQGEAKQASELMRQSHAHAEEGHGNTLHRQRHAYLAKCLLYNGYTLRHGHGSSSQLDGGCSNISSPPSTLATQPALVAVCVLYLVSYFSHSAAVRGPALGRALCIMPAWPCVWVAETKICVTLLGLLCFELRWLLVAMNE